MNYASLLGLLAKIKCSPSSHRFSRIGVLFQPYPDTILAVFNFFPMDIRGADKYNRFTLPNVYDHTTMNTPVLV